ncbi:hypothetical protein OROMI_029497 [Orobanche minor]
MVYTEIGSLNISGIHDFFSRLAVMMYTEIGSDGTVVKYFCNSRLLFEIGSDGTLVKCFWNSRLLFEIGSDTEIGSDGTPS